MTTPNIIKNRQIKGDIAVLGPLAIGGTILLYKALPYINNFLDMLQTGIMRGLVIGGMLTVGAVLATNYKTILRLSRVISRNITRQFVAIDPVGFLEEIFSDAQDRHTMLKEKASIIRGVIESIAEELQDLEKAIKQTLNRAKVVNDPYAAQILGRDLERKEASREKIKNNILKFEKFDKAITKMREICEFRMQDLTSQLEEAKRQDRVNKKTKGIVDDLRFLFNPGNDDVQWNDAILEIESQWGETRADMDLFMEDVSSIIANHDIDGEIALARVEELQKKYDPSLKVRIENPSTTKQTVNEVEEIHLGIDTSRFKRSDLSLK